MKKTETLPAEQLLPGMTVMAQVVDAGGHILLPIGAELSESTIAGLIRREIEEVSVEMEVEEDPADLEKYREMLARRLDHIFRRAGEEPETRALYQAVFDYRLEHRL